MIRLTGLLLLLLSAACAASCGYYEAQENTAKLSDIRVGMTRAQVRAVMGDPPDEPFQDPDVWFYYTSPKWYDGYVTSDECTPFVFDRDEDRLNGFGYDYLKAHDPVDEWNANRSTLRKTAARAAARLRGK